jgi:hypothetical protein
MALVEVTVVLCDFWRLWIREFLDEPGADAHRLVEYFATVWTAITGDLDLLVWVRCSSPLRIVSRLPTWCTTVSTSLFVVLVLIGRGRLLLVRLVLARWCMRSFVPPEPGSEAFVLLAELLVFFAELLVLFLELFVFFSQLFVFLALFVEFLFKISKLCERSCSV